MNERKRILLLILIMAAVGIVGGGATVGVLYRLAINPAAVVNLGGLVTVNLDEISTLFIWAGSIVAVIAILVNVVGGLLFFRFTDPIIKNLHQSERRFHSVVDAATDAIIAADSSGKIVSWNKGASLVFGYGEDEVMGSSLTRLIPGRFQEAHEAGLKHARDTGETRLVGKTVELEGVRKGGDEFPLELSLGSWTADGETFFTGIIRDITERKRVEVQVHELAKYPELNPGPVMRFSEDGDLVYANDASGNLRNCYNCETGKAFTEEWRETFKEAFQTGEIKEIDFSCAIATCGLEDKTFSLLIKPVPENASVYVFGRDITERKQMEAQLIQSEKMAAIGTMTSGIGHEINNPLYAILGLAEAVRDAKDISKCREHGRDIIKYSKQISEIVKNLSGYVRPAHNHELEQTNINDQISEATAMVRLSLLSDHVEFMEDLAPLPEILTKSEEIQQVFFNVIRNGVQAIGGKGTLGITSRHVGDRVRVQIQDSGIGISEENLEKIFDPFFTTKGPDEGEGLGLYVVRKIVDKYCGTIAFESRNGKGATCIIEFPTP